MLKIADIELANPVIAAPLAGISTDAYRSLCLEFGCGLVYTEMTSSEALHYHNVRTFEMCDVPADNRPIALQLFGSRVEAMVEAAVYVDQHSSADIIDINMGCPVNKVVKTGAGSALMREPEKAFTMVREMVKHVHKPVTVKMRLGYNESEKNYLMFAKGLEQAGASAIAVHGRTRSQMYEGEADWQAIKEIKEAVSIPVFGNGDVKSVDDFFKRKQESGVDAIMIGRGLIGNPFLIKEIVNTLNGCENSEVTLQERFDACKIHATRLALQIGEDKAIREMRGIAANYLKGLPFSASFRGKCASLTTLDDLNCLLNEYRRLATERIG